jgi:hypothetical protein
VVTSKRREQRSEKKRIQMNRLLVGLLGVGLVLGLKYYNRSSAATDVKAHLVQLCEGESGCLSAVEHNFDGCFEQAYKMGGRRQASHLESGELVQCLNDKGRKSYFALAY